MLLLLSPLRAILTEFSQNVTLDTLWQNPYRSQWPLATTTTGISLCDEGPVTSK